MRHFTGRTPVLEILERPTREELAGVGVSAFECDVRQAEELSAMARGHCPPAIEHAMFAATAG
jgi:hypothetical protein